MGKNREAWYAAVRGAHKQSDTTYQLNNNHPSCKDNAGWLKEHEPSFDQLLMPGYNLLNLCVFYSFKFSEGKGIASGSFRLLSFVSHFDGFLPPVQESAAALWESPLPQKEGPSEAALPEVPLTSAHLGGLGSVWRQISEP